MGYWTKVLIALFAVTATFVFFAVVLFPGTKGILFATAVALLGLLLFFFDDIARESIMEDDSDSDDDRIEM